MGMSKEGVLQRVMAKRGVNRKEALKIAKKESLFKKPETKAQLREKAKKALVGKKKALWRQ